MSQTHEAAAVLEARGGGSSALRGSSKAGQLKLNTEMIHTAGV